MLKALMFAAGAVHANLLHSDEHDYIMDLLRDVNPHTIKAHPVVEATATCSTTVARLKKGPANIPAELYWGSQNSTYKFTDTDFTGVDTLY
jgi:hypothetical protein